MTERHARDCLFGSRGMVVGSLLLATAGGCGNTSNRRDASRDVVDPPDARREQPPLVTGTVVDSSDPTLAASPRPADLSCLDAAPTPPSFVASSLWVQGSSGPLEGVCVRLYDGPVPPGDSCRDDDPRTDASGVLNVVPPRTSPFSARFFARPADTAFETHLETVVSDMQEEASRVVVLSSAAVNEAALLTGVRRDPAAATLLVRIGDCRRFPVLGATLRLRRADGTPIDVASGRTRVLYGDGREFLSAVQPWTHLDGVAGATNIEVREPGEQIFVEMLGRRSLRDEPATFACATVRIFPGVVSAALSVRPRDSGGASCPPTP